MAIGTVLENLSNRKLFGILCFLLVAQIFFVLLGAVFAPSPSTSMEFLMSRCRDPKAGKSKDWFYIRPKACELIETLSDYHSVSSDVRDIVFVAQMPHVRGGLSLEYSPWFQFLLGLLDVDIAFDPNFSLAENAEIQIEVRMGYRNREDNETQWTEFISTTINRELKCSIDNDKRRKGFTYNCSTIDLFELGANNYPFYLLNLRLPVNQSVCASNPNGPNCAIGMINDLRVIAIHQNGGFTAVWLWMKTLISPLAILMTRWYYQRMTLLNRQRFLIEKCILTLGISLVILDFPIEWISLWFRVPFMLLVGDIRQGLFYAVLFSFWLVYAGEHLLDDGSRNNLWNYKMNLTLVLGSCLSLLAYDLFERGLQLSNPFHSIWASEMGRRFGYGSLYVATICSALYFGFLLYKVLKAWTTIKHTRSAQLYRMSERSRLKAETVIYRFKFLMFFTLTCAFFTMISYFMKQYGEGQLHGDDYEESSWMSKSTSAFFTGTFGMWNLYVLLLLSMYAPSHKHYSDSQVLEDENADLIDMGTESAPMTTFLKSATD